MPSLHLLPTCEVGKVFLPTHFVLLLNGISKRSIAFIPIWSGLTIKFLRTLCQLLLNGMLLFCSVEWLEAFVYPKMWSFCFVKIFLLTHFVLYSFWQVLKGKSMRSVALIPIWSGQSSKNFVSIALEWEMLKLQNVMNKENL